MELQKQLSTQGDFLFRNRSYLPLLLLVVGLWAYIQNEINEIEIEEGWLIERLEYFYFGVSLLGLFIRILTVGHTLKNTSGRNTKEGQVAAKLNTTGIYSIVRHPLYLGNYFMWLGLALLTENGWFIVVFSLFFLCYYERIIFTEEIFLRIRFGKPYLDWAKNTPTFIPVFKKWKKPAMGFSWKKVLKKEKNGFTAIFLLFWLFEFVGEWAENGNIVLEIDFWFYGALMAVLVYAILKLLKKYRLFDETYR